MRSRQFFKPKGAAVYGAATVAIALLLVGSNIPARGQERAREQVEEPTEELTPEELAALAQAEREDAGERHQLKVDPKVEADASSFDTEELPEESASQSLARGRPRGPKPQLKWGLHPRASDGLRAAGVSAGRLSQTIGGAEDSRGTHKQDGVFQGKQYTAATDISVRGMSDQQIKNLLSRLHRVGFAAWYRQNGHDGWRGANHIHAVYANSRMKPALRAQVKSWLAGRNGLRSNMPYQFYRSSRNAKANVRAMFNASGGGQRN
jgi:hypothetical protein